MESRTSPGKTGSVQPISECLKAASPLSQAWECTFFGLGWLSWASVSGESVVPARVVGGHEGLFAHQCLPSSCPGCPESPAERLGYGPPLISSRVSEVCGLPFGCLVDSLGKCAFGCGNNAVPACARGYVSKSRSSARMVSPQTALSCLASDLCLFLPCNSVHVSISSRLDEALAS
jgi:hypothetical protein